MVYTQCWHRALNNLKKRKSTGDCSELSTTSKARAASNQLYISDIIPTRLRPRKTKSVAAAKVLISNEPEVKASRNSDSDHQPP